MARGRVIVVLDADPDLGLRMLPGPPGAPVEASAEHRAELAMALEGVRGRVDADEGAAVLNPVDEPVDVDARRVDRRKEDHGIVPGELVPGDVAAVLGDRDLEHALAQLVEAS